MAFDPQQLIPTLLRLPEAQRYRVAFSGGLDSTVLLQALAGIRASLPGGLEAVHVNHGLHPQADAWTVHCERVCRELGVPLTVRQVQVRPETGESLEAVARARRYEVFKELMGSAEVLLLAHHQDDQMETFLLQGLRGAGLRGLAAMPESLPFGKGRLVRPLLGYARVELEAWARSAGLGWLEDPSNADTRFDRNYLRHEVLPVLRRRWPSAGETLTRSARHCGEALDLLEDLAAMDLERHAAGDTLDAGALEVLSAARAGNLIRHWLKRRGLPSPPAHKLEEIRLQGRARRDRNPCVAWEGAEVRRYRGRLYAMQPLPGHPEAFTLRPETEHAIGQGLGILRLAESRGEGIRAALATDPLRVAFRHGGEVCQPAGRAHHRPLKKWLQDMHVVPWLRASLPLIYAEGELVAVAGLFVCEGHAALPGEAGLRIDWRDHPPLR